MTDAHQYIHGIKFAVYGDPDYLAGYLSFLLEMGAEPVHILCSKGSKKLEKELQGMLDGKFDSRDARIPLFRFGFPIFDRVNKHRYPLIGYAGVINMVTEICNKFIDIKDDTCENRFFELMR